MTTAIVHVPGTNVRNVINCFDDARLVRRPADLDAETGVVILPGVNHYANYVAFLRDNGWFERLHDWRAGAPAPVLVAICSGFQALCRSSEEGPGLAGLGIFEADVVRLRADTRAAPPNKTPSIGLRPLHSTTGMPPLARAYFIHSFGVLADHRPTERQWYDRGADRVVAAMSAGPFLGLQYHPELSGLDGRAFLNEVCMKGTR